MRLLKLSVLLLVFSTNPAISSATNESEKLGLFSNEDPLNTLHLMNLLFFLHYEHNPGLDLYEHEWVKPMLLTLAVNGNKLRAPEICRTTNLADVTEAINKFDFSTADFATYKTGLWVKRAALEINGDHKAADAAAEIATWWSRLKWLEALFESSIEIAKSHPRSDVQELATSFFAQKGRYEGYCETSRTWTTAPQELRKGIPSTLRLFVTLAKHLALQTGTGDKFYEFIVRMKLEDILNSVDPTIDPFARFKNDLLEEAKNLGIADFLEGYSPKDPSATQDEIFSVIKEMQAFSVFNDISKSWNYLSGTIAIGRLPYHKDFDLENKYVSWNVNDAFGRSFATFRSNFKSANALIVEAEIIGSWHFAFNIMPGVKDLLARVNDASREYLGRTWDELKSDFRTKYLKNAPTIESTLALSLHLRWLKTMSTRLDLSAKYAAFIEHHDLTPHAPAADDQETMWQWLDRHLPDLAHERGISFPDIG